MHIVLSSAGFFPDSFGGGPIYVYRLAHQLLNRGHQVTVLTASTWKYTHQSYTTNAYTYDDISVQSFSLNPERISPAEKHTGFGPVTLHAFSDILKNLQPEIVHINGMKAAMTLACKELNIPHIITAHHTGIVCPAGSLLLPDHSICDIPANSNDCVPCANFSRRPHWYTGGLLGHLPALLYRPLGRRLNRFKNPPYLFRGLIHPWLVEQSLKTHKILLGNLPAIISPSKFIKSLLIKNGCPPDKINVIPHGIHPIKIGKPESLDKRPIRFGYIGRINFPKGLHLIIDALKQLPAPWECELNIFGKAQLPWEERYLTELQKNYDSGSKILLHGYIPSENISKAFNAIDVLIVPSIIPEAFGLVVAEAFSAGRPVIVSDAGALPELVTHGKNGFIVERNNSAALMEAMQIFIADPERILLMAQELPPVKTTNEYVDDLLHLYEKQR